MIIDTSTKSKDGALKFTARFHLKTNELILSYEVVNTSTQDVYLLNRVYRLVNGSNRVSPDTIYIHLDPSTKTVWLNKQTPELPSEPPGITVDVPEMPLVTALRAGTSFREDVHIPLPIEQFKAYNPMAGPKPAVPTLSTYKTVYFTLQYLRRRPEWIEEIIEFSGEKDIVPKTPPGIPIQSSNDDWGKLETERLRLDLPVIDPPPRRVPSWIK